MKLIASFAAAVFLTLSFSTKADSVVVNATVENQVSTPYAIIGDGPPFVVMNLQMTAEFRVPTFASGTSLDSATFMLSGGAAVYGGVIDNPGQTSFYKEVTLRASLFVGSIKVAEEDGWEISHGPTSASVDLSVIAGRLNNYVLALSFQPSDFVAGSSKDRGGYVPIFFDMEADVDAFSLSPGVPFGGIYLAPFSLAVSFESQNSLTNPTGNMGRASTAELNPWLTGAPNGQLPSELGNLLPQWVPIPQVPEPDTGTYMVLGLALCWARVLWARSRSEGG